MALKQLTIFLQARNREQIDDEAISAKSHGLLTLQSISLYR